LGGFLVSDRIFNLAVTILRWIGLAITAVPRFLGRQRNKGLQKYRCTLQWIEAGIGHEVMVDVKAKNENEARQFANEGARKSLPKIQIKPLSKDMIDPPYIKDAKATLPQWKVEVLPLSDRDREDIENGVFGPAGAFNVGSQMG
jgi:hypothetical protein